MVMAVVVAVVAVVAAVGQEVLLLLEGGQRGHAAALVHAEPVIDQL